MRHVLVTRAKFLRSGRSIGTFAYGFRSIEAPIDIPDSLFAKTLNWRRVNIQPERRRMFRQLNSCHVPDYSPICVDTHDPFTIECGFLKRLFRDLPIGDGLVLARFRRFVRLWLETHLVPFTCFNFDSLYDDWYRHLKFPESRLKQYRDAHDRLVGGCPSSKQCSHVDSFPKTEFYDELKQLRMINSRSDAFKVFSGPYFYAIEKEIYRLPWFVKNLTLEQEMVRIESLDIPGREFFVSDFSAFESHFVPEFLSACECQLYEYLFPCPHMRLINSTLCGKNRLHLRFGMRVSVEGRRMSGDMCTSIGNGFTNLMLFLFLMYERFGLAPDYNGDLPFDGIVEGDDGLFAVPFGTAPSVDDYKHLGFTIKIESCESPMRASFCRKVFGKSHQCIREPRRFLSSFGWTHSFLMGGRRLMDSLLRAKALSCLYETPHCPIVAPLAHLALRNTNYVTPRWKFRSFDFVSIDGWKFIPSDVLKIPIFQPTLETRQLFADMYGISIVVQLSVEDAISKGRLDQIPLLLPPSSDSLWFSHRYVR